MEILCPILLVLFGLLISKVEMLGSSLIVEVNLGLTGKQEILFSSMNNIISKAYFKNTSNVLFTDISINNEADNVENRIRLSRKFFEDVYNRTYQLEDRLNQTIDMSNENYRGIYSSILLFSNENNRYEFIMALNSRVKHCIPIYSHYILSSIIQKE